MKYLSSSLVLALVLGVSTGASADILKQTELNSANISISNPNLLLAAKTNTGNFVGVDHPTQGQVKIIVENGVKYLEISQNFKTDRGPDLKVILHNSSTVNARVKEGEYINLGKLKSVNGGQRYQLPENLNLDEYQSVAIWCEQFNVTFGYATLN